MSRQVNICDAKTQLSRLVEEAAAAGAEIVIARNGKPLARLTNIVVATKAQRKLGFWEGQGGWIADDFDKADPDLEHLFYEGDLSSALDARAGVKRSPARAVKIKAARVGKHAKKLRA